MKKILVFVNSMSHAGGIERVIANLVNEWCKKYDMTILTKDTQKSFYKIDDNVKIHNLNCGITLNMNNRIQREFAILVNLFKTKRKLKKYLNENKIDYIYVTTPLNALEIYEMGGSYRKKLVVSEHASKFACNKIYQIIRKFVYPRIYCLSVPTTMDTKLYLEEGCNSVYIPHLSTFTAEEKSKLNTKKAINIGRLTSDKQQQILVKMWKDLCDQNKLDGWKLIIVGKGEEKPKLVDYIKKNCLENYISVINPISDVDKIYKNADLFLLTSKAEGFGMVLLEAMAFGIPCISFDCPSGPRDIIKEEVNGYLVPCFDKNEYMKKIEELIKNRQRLKDMGNEAYKTVKNWNNTEILQKWDEVFY